MTPTPEDESALHYKVTHGDTIMKKAVKALGVRAIDGRTSLAKELEAEQRELIAALGGTSEISPQQKRIIEILAQKRLRRWPVAQWALLNRERLLNRRKMSMIPIALQLVQMEESEVRLLKELGLERRANQLPSLHKYVNGKAAPPVSDADHEVKGSKP